MILCIAGKNSIAVNALRATCEHHDVICLPNPGDDGQDGWQPSLRKAAGELGVPIVLLDDLYRMKDLCFLSLEYAKIVRPEQFSTDKLFNVHFSLLPDYRGCNTAIWPILNGEPEHGVTLHVIDAGIDTGPIVDQRRFALAGLTAEQAYFRCMTLGLKMALDWLPALMNGEYVVEQQTEGGSTYKRDSLDFSLKEIDLRQDRASVLRRLRAFTFPAYQRPTYRGREIARWTDNPASLSDWTELRAADDSIFVRFEDA